MFAKTSSFARPSALRKFGAIFGLGIGLFALGGCAEYARIKPLLESSDEGGAYIALVPFHNDDEGKKALATSRAHIEDAQKEATRLRLRANALKTQASAEVPIKSIR